MSIYLVARGHVPMDIEQPIATREPEQLAEGWLRIAEVAVAPFRVPTSTYQPFQTVPLELTRPAKYDFSPELLYRSRHNSESPIRFSGRIALNQTVYEIDGYYYRSGSIHGALDVMPTQHHPIFFERLLAREQQIRDEQQAASIASRARRQERSVQATTVKRFWSHFSKNRR